ncbi:Ig-like domain-containing protein [Pleurocapsa sp. PCC 7327]|uniref:Ig-like domain-containing protein n=1 Tax=Pleurocapsa sp. PCC 7327 TaxID=118163 RepID=UPI0002D9CEA7|nr:Ig-like domain-containing protein [Pleurocapsa sp. PCC 7327]
MADSVDSTTNGTPLSLPDTDGDGIRDFQDLDSDNDGITDVIEAGGVDANGDGIIDNFSDSNGNGLADSVEGSPLPVPDTDGDGIRDFQDLDSDNDGITDVIEAGGIDANGDGIIDNFIDSNGNGVADSVEGSPLPVPDTDGDGIRDFQDLDSDNDGITDVIEAGGVDTNGDGIIDNFVDSNGDGLADSVAPATGGTPLSAPDSDGDGIRDFQDLDSDGDGQFDLVEAGGVDANNDGKVDNFSDSNGDGLADSVDPKTGGVPLNPNRDSDGNGLADRLDNGDFDGDGIPDSADLDDDNDGILDSIEQNGDPTRDTDGDGIPDSFDLDSDNDGIADLVEAGGVDANGDGIIDNFVDSNGNGLADSQEGSPLPVPDTDGDGVQDFQDLDSDNDGITDVVEAGGIDANGDGIIDNFVDSNSDGIADRVSSSTGGTPLSLPDTDGDGIRDFRDLDSDNDGITDIIEAGGIDANGDGIIDNFVDSNGDGLADNVDPVAVPDSDGDGIRDFQDLDSDNDGITDVIEAGGIDANGDGIIDNFVDSNGNGLADSQEGSPLPVPDTDGDGVRDFQDLDSDNDGITDVIEAGGIDANGDGIIDNFVDSNGNGLADSQEGSPLPVPDTDGDGVQDFQDLDSDNDGITDVVEAGGIDANGDGIIDNFVDSNGDGLSDSVAPATGGTPLSAPDTDGDGIRDFQDLDSDGDGQFDLVEAGGVDANNDGRIDNFSDSNGDGLADSIDPKTGGVPLNPNLDSDGNGLADRLDNGDFDGDGIPDSADLDDDNDGILDSIEQNGDPTRDTDGDGIPDSFDLDSDNDGIADLVEAGGVDANGDGIIDNFIDSNGNGVADSVEGSPLPVPDTDGDGVRDFQDLDSDNDGITDVIEAGGIDANGDGIIDNFVDSNSDGIADRVSSSTGGTPLSAPDIDGDGISDFRDLDSDGDGQFDLVEAGGVDANNDGKVDNFSDSNGDGLADSVDPKTGGVPLNPNLDSDGNGLADRLDNGDFDGDGIPDSADLDDDNDGILDSIEQNGDPTRDSDGDGIPDSFDLDSDNDGIADLVEAGGTDANGDGIIDNFSDSNGNGLADNVEGSPLPIPDTDGDGVRDFQDLDSDNDGITDVIEAGGIDANGDGIIDNFVDSNGDGIADRVSSSTGGTPLSLPDIDGDGIRDFQDLDSDGDGQFDLVEAGGVDANNDGRIDNFSDSNGDGLADSVDPKTGGVPLNPNLDSDGNGIPDRTDSRIPDRDPNRPLVQAADDRGRTLRDTPIFLNVLNNDAKGLRISSITNPANGTVTINDNGTPNDPTDDFLVYTPNPGFTGSDSFSYTARDAQGNEFTANVAVAVRNPSPAKDDSIATPPNKPVNIRVLDNDGRGLRIGSVTNPVNGTVTINDNGTPNDPRDDFLVYTPNPGFEGKDEFTYTAIDALGNSYEAIVSVKVDPNRPNAADDDVSVIPGADVFINVLGNDSDPNRQALRIVSVTQGLRGTVRIDDNGTPDDPSDDRILYAPNDRGESVFSLNRAGNRGLFSIRGNFQPFTDTFSYTVSDPDGNEETATVNVNVAPEVRLKFTLTENQADLVSEVGFFKVDDENGTIDGIAPGEAGYVEAALRSGRVIFSSLSGYSQLFGENPTRIMEGFRSDDLLNFFFVQDSTVDEVLARIDAGEIPDNVFFATTEANNDNFNHLEVGEVESAFSLGWEDRGQRSDRDFNDMRLTVEVTDEPIPIGSKLQGDGQRELLDLTELTGQTLQAQISIFQEASYDNIVGLYRLEDATGAVRDPLTGALITPGQQGYTEAALAQSVGQFDEDTTSATVNVEGGVFYAPYILANGSQSQAYFPFLASNADGFDHLRLLGDNTFGFEDLVNGGDADYNDAVIRVAITPI